MQEVCVCGCVCVGDAATDVDREEEDGARLRAASDEGFECFSCSVASLQDFNFQCFVSSGSIQIKSAAAVTF